MKFTTLLEAELPESARVGHESIASSIETSVTVSQANDCIPLLWWGLFRKDSEVVQNCYGYSVVEDHNLALQSFKRFTNKLQESNLFSKEINLDDSIRKLSEQLRFVPVGSKFVITIRETEDAEELSGGDEHQSGGDEHQSGDDIHRLLSSGLALSSAVKEGTAKTSDPILLKLLASLSKDSSSLEHYLIGEVRNQ